MTLNRHFARIAQLLKEAGSGWIKHRAQKLGASLAFYTMLALAPLSILAVVVTGYFLGEEAARGGIVDRLGTMVGTEAAATIESLIETASEPRQSRIATVISLVVLVFGASGVFAELKDSLDIIWEVQPKPGGGIWAIAKTRISAFVVVISTGFLLLVSLVLTAVLTGLTEWLGQSLPVPVWTAYLLDMLVSFTVIALLFALIFKLLPDARIDWPDTWFGAALTALLCMVGKFLIGIYIGRLSIGSVYGAAGSLVVLLVWTYYSAQILFFGAELTRACARLGRPAD